MDYRIDGPIVFPAGNSAAKNSTQCIVVEIIDDENVEDTEQFLLILTPRSTGCTLYGDPSVSGSLHLEVIDNPTYGNCCAKMKNEITWMNFFYSTVAVLSFESSNMTIREGQDQVLKVCILIEKGKFSRNVSTTLVTTDITGENNLLINSVHHACTPCVYTMCFKL